MSQKADGQFSCIQCDYANESKRNLTRHMHSVHEGMRFDCDMCEYKATKITNLLQHLRSVHEKLKYPALNVILFA